MPGKINRHEFQAAYDRRSLLRLGEIVESQREELHCARAEEVQQRDQQLLQGQLLQHNLELRDAHQRSLTEIEELRKFQSSTFRYYYETKINRGSEHYFGSGRVQELQNEVNCMNDSKEFQDAESVRSGNSHVTSRPVFFLPHPNPQGMQSRSLGIPSRNDRPPIIWDTHGFSGNVFANLTASSSSTYPGGFNPWTSNVSEYTSPHVTSERQHRHNFGSEMPVRTVSQKFIRP